MCFIISEIKNKWTEQKCGFLLNGIRNTKGKILSVTHENMFKVGLTVLIQFGLVSIVPLGNVTNPQDVLLHQILHLDL